MMNIKIPAHEDYENTTVSFYMHAYTYVRMYICVCLASGGEF